MRDVFLLVFFQCRFIGGPAFVHRVSSEANGEGAGLLFGHILTGCLAAIEWN